MSLKSVFSSSRLKVVDTLWRGNQPAWEIHSSILKLIITKHGLNIASVSLQDDLKNTNPFWIPPWSWHDPSTIEHMNIKDEHLLQQYGNREDSQLLMNICGHNICMDRFGLCREQDIPRTCHGEAPIIKWHLDQLTNDMVTFSCTLPIAHLYLHRSFAFDGDRVYVTTNVQDCTPSYEYFMNSKCFSLNDNLDNNNNNNNNNSNNDNNNNNNFNKVEALHHYFTDVRQQMASNATPSSAAFTEFKDKRKRLIQRFNRREMDQKHNYHLIEGMMEHALSMQEQEEKKSSSLSILEKWLPERFQSIFTSSKKQQSQSQSSIVITDEPPSSNEILNYRRKRDTQANLIKEDDPNKYKVSMLKKPRLDVEWCEHVTIGDPFLNGCDIETSCVKGYNFIESMPMSRFKNEETLKEIDQKKLLSMPNMNDNSCKIEECTTLLCDLNQEWNSFMIKNKNLGYELEYNWNSTVWPWLVVWTEHFARSMPPWNVRTRTRALEFSSKPFPIPNLEKVIPKQRLGNLINDKTFGSKVYTFDQVPINFVLPKEGRTEVFSFRWNYLGRQ